jgi:hypothetical protein
MGTSNLAEQSNKRTRDEVEDLLEQVSRGEPEEDDEPRSGTRKELGKMTCLGSIPHPTSYVATAALKPAKPCVSQRRPIRSQVPLTSC